MYGAGEMFGSFELAFDERFVDHDLGAHIGKFAFLPKFHLFSHRPEVALHSVHAD